MGTGHLALALLLVMAPSIQAEPWKLVGDEAICASDTPIINCDVADGSWGHPYIATPEFVCLADCPSVQCPGSSAKAFVALCDLTKVVRILYPNLQSGADLVHGVVIQNAPAWIDQGFISSSSTGVSAIGHYPLRVTGVELAAGSAPMIGADPHHEGPTLSALIYRSGGPIDLANVSLDGRRTEHALIISDADATITETEVGPGIHGGILAMQGSHLELSKSVLGVGMRPTAFLAEPLENLTAVRSNEEGSSVQLMRSSATVRESIFQGPNGAFEIESNLPVRMEFNQFDLPQGQAALNGFGQCDIQLHFNDLDSGTLYADEACTIDARWNWWGSPDGPGPLQERSAGGVDQSAWLHAPFAELPEVDVYAIKPHHEVIRIAGNASGVNEIHRVELLPPGVDEWWDGIHIETIGSWQHHWMVRDQQRGNHDWSVRACYTIDCSRPITFQVEVSEHPGNPVALLQLPKEIIQGVPVMIDASTSYSEPGFALTYRITIDGVQSDWQSMPRFIWLPDQAGPVSIILDVRDSTEVLAEPFRLTVHVSPSDDDVEVAGRLVPALSPALLILTALYLGWMRK